VVPPAREVFCSRRTRRTAFRTRASAAASRASACSISCARVPASRRRRTSRCAATLASASASCAFSRWRSSRASTWPRSTVSPSSTSTSAISACSLKASRASRSSTFPYSVSRLDTAASGRDCHQYVPAMATASNPSSKTTSPARRLIVPALYRGRYEARAPPAARSKRPSCGARGAPRSNVSIQSFGES